MDRDELIAALKQKFGPKDTVWFGCEMGMALFAIDVMPAVNDEDRHRPAIVMLGEDEIDGGDTVYAIAKEADVVDAARWRALLACERIRIVGSSKLGTPNGHIGLELWAKYPGEHEDNRQTLIAFVDGMQR